MCPLGAAKARTTTLLISIRTKDIEYNLIKQDGLVGIYGEHLTLDHGVAAIDRHMFDQGRP